MHRPVMPRWLPGALALIASLFIAGCASAPPVRTMPAAVPARVTDIGGKFSMRYTASTPTARTEFVAGSFALHRDPQRISLDLTSPFGQQIAHAEQPMPSAGAGEASAAAATLDAGSEAIVRTADHREIRGRTLDDVIHQALGFRVPASRLPDWLDDRFEHVIARTDNPSMIRATDSGWNIERRDNRWNLLWDRAGERIEVRLVAQPSPVAAR